MSAPPSNSPASGVGAHIIDIVIVIIGGSKVKAEDGGGGGGRPAMNDDRLRRLRQMATPPEGGRISPNPPPPPLLLPRAIWRLAHPRIPWPCWRGKAHAEIDHILSCPLRGSLRRRHGTVQPRRRRLERIVLLGDPPAAHPITCSAKGEFSMVEAAYELLCGESDEAADAAEGGVATSAGCLQRPRRGPTNPPPLPPSSSSSSQPRMQ